MPARLKSLELHGYKTFANLTTFEFAELVTAIVGPNGSGKSNIADSLRWVLGEQSFSLLRGKKSEDMIFSGSEMRPRAGMASAMVTFDNGDGWLPIDFSEVSITRRAYRDGQNEYLINGQRVRLKDVSELLAQSGLAERTYTIIGQGLVDAALSLKAEERRRLFEEAAGVGLHRTRREDALRRLDLTQRNLERIRDILAELEPRLQSLERQARRAQEHDRVKADLRLALRDWYGYHWHHSQEEMGDALLAARQQEEALNHVRQEQEGLEKKLNVLVDRLQRIRLQLNQWHQQMTQLHGWREELNRNLAVAEERTHSLGNQKISINDEVIRAEEETQLFQVQLLTAQQEFNSAQGNLEEAQNQLSQAQQRMDAHRKERQKVENQVQALRQTLGNLNNRQSQQQARLSEKRAQADRNQKALQEYLANDQIMAGELKNAEEKFNHTQQTLAAMEMNRTTAESALRTQAEGLGVLENKRKSRLDQRSAVLTEIARLKAQLGVLDHAEAALIGYADGTQLLMQAAQEKKLPGIVGTLTGLLDVPVEFETAISAALGEFLDAVLTESDPEQAVELLQKRAGKGVLLPMNVHLPGIPGLVGEVKLDEASAGWVGRASDLVQYSPKIAPVVHLLLDWVWVVKDRLTARHLIKSTIERTTGSPQISALLSSLRIVTLQGEVYLAGGPVLVQATRPQTRQDSLLGRQRQRRELRQSLQQLEADLELTNQDLSTIDQEYKRQQSERERLAQAARNAQQEVDQISLNVQQTRLALDQLRKQARWQIDQRTRLQKEIDAGEVEAGNLTKDLERSQQEVNELRERLREVNRIFAELSGATADEHQAELTHWKTSLALAERAAADAATRVQERQETIARLSTAKQKSLARHETIDKELRELEQQITKWREAEAEVGQKIDALQITIDPAEAELVQIEQQQILLQSEVTTSRQGLSLAEQRYSQTRITLARRQEALQALRRRIEDDFGLVAFEYTEQVAGPTPLPLEGMVEQLPRLAQIPPEVEENIKRLRAQLRRIGAINPEAQLEYQEVNQRFVFLKEQIKDLEKAELDIRQVIVELDRLMEQEFQHTYEAVAGEFRQIFTRLFGGGSARLVLTDPDNLTDTGIDIEARLPGRRSQGLSLLSGGERSLTAAALVFALLKVSPTPFCVLDEVDAMLDEANVGRFRELLRELSQNTQFIIVTHNRNTVQAAEVIYGVTMGPDSVSQVLSLKMDEINQVVD